MTTPPIEPLSTPAEPRRRRTLVWKIAIGVVAAFVLIALTVVATRLFAETAPDTAAPVAATESDAPTPTAPTPSSAPSLTPSSVPSPIPVATAKAPAKQQPATPKPSFLSLSIDPATFYCPAPTEPTRYAEVTISWKVANTTEVWVGTGADATKDPYASQLRPEDDFSYTDDCPLPATTTWTVTAKGPGGTVTKTVSIPNIGYTRPG